MMNTFKDEYISVKCMYVGSNSNKYCLNHILLKQQTTNMLIDFG